MKILLLGATGLAGQAVAKEAGRRGISVQTVARSGALWNCDIANKDSLRALLASVEHDVVFNCVANIDVLDCEKDFDRAYEVNAQPAMLLAEWSRNTGTRFLQVSTDHYYTTGDNRPHTEVEPVELVNHYARTKYQAEEFALQSPLATIVRTAIVGVRGWEKPTFAEWAMQVAARDQEVVLFDDAFTSLIDVSSFANAAIELVLRNLSGIYNVASSEVFTKGEFVREIARQMGTCLTNAKSGSVGTLDPPRARCLGLAVDRVQAALGYRLPDLKAVVKNVLQNAGT